MFLKSMFVSTSLHVVVSYSVYCCCTVIKISFSSTCKHVYHLSLSLDTNHSMLIKECVAFIFNVTVLEKNPSLWMPWAVFVWEAHCIKGVLKQHYSILHQTKLKSPFHTWKPHISNQVSGHSGPDTWSVLFTLVLNSRKLSKCVFMIIKRWSFIHPNCVCLWIWVFSHS